MNSSSSEKFKRLRWQCRRGMLELDILLLRFLDSSFENASLDDQSSFMKLLQEPDQSLFDWLIRQKECPRQEYRALITTISLYDQD